MISKMLLVANVVCMILGTYAAAMKQPDYAAEFYALAAALIGSAIWIRGDR